MNHGNFDTISRVTRITSDETLKEKKEKYYKKMK